MVNKTMTMWPQSYTASSIPVLSEEMGTEYLLFKVSMDPRGLFELLTFHRWAISYECFWHSINRVSNTWTKNALKFMYDHMTIRVKVFYYYIDESF